MVSITINHAHDHTHPHEHGPAPVNTTPSPERVEMPAISVNGVVIAKKAIAAEVQTIPARNPGEGWRRASQALVIRELLLQEAHRLGIVADQRVDADGRRETEDDALIRGLIEREVTVPVADRETCLRYYTQNISRFTTAPLYEADHILLNAPRSDHAAFAQAEATIAALAARLATQPEHFEAIARDHSECPSATVGGSLGQIGPGDTTPEFEAALVRLRAGEISAPVATRYGWHLIRLNRRVDGRQLPFDAVADQIARYLDDHVRRQASVQYIALLAGKADIRGITLHAATTPLVQ